MKVIPIALQEEYDTGSARIATALRITRTDGEVYGFTSADIDAVIGGVTYDSAQGFSGSDIVTSAGLAVDNLELSTLDDGSFFQRADIITGIWQNAAFLIFRYCYADLTKGIEPITAGTIGQVQLKRGVIIAELRGLQQYLQQPIGSVTSKTCRARFADFPTPNGRNKCRLNHEDYRETLTVDSVTNRRLFSAGGSIQPDDWYGEGLLTWTSGANIGLRFKIKAFEGSPGDFELLTDTPYAIAPGDTFSALAGCRKRLAEDCLAKFDNVLNFAGEPHLPGVDLLTATPTPSAS